MGPCIAMGEAAGIATALALEENKSYNKVNTNTLREKIVAKGGLVDRVQQASKDYFNRKPLVDKQIDEDVRTITPRPSGTEIETVPYPDELVSRCLDIGCPENGVVLDPFAGSGTTMNCELGQMIMLSKSRKQLSLNKRKKLQFMLGVVRSFIKHMEVCLLFVSRDPNLCNRCTT